jgi:hypothetical protein
MTNRDKQGGLIGGVGSINYFGKIQNSRKNKKIMHPLPPVWTPLFITIYNAKKNQQSRTKRWG